MTTDRSTSRAHGPDSPRPNPGCTAWAPPRLALYPDGWLDPYDVRIVAGEDLVAFDLARGWL